MPAPLRARFWSSAEQDAIERLARSRTAPARLVERTRIVLLSRQGDGVAEVAEKLGVCQDTVRRWIHRFDRQGVAGLEDQPRGGRPPTYSAEEVGEVVSASLTKPAELGLPFACWTLDRLAAYLNEEQGIPIKRSRISEILVAEGLRWRDEETWFGERPDPAFAEKGAIVARYTEPPEGSVVICLDEMGPVAAKSYPGRAAVRPAPEDGAGRAAQEVDYGRRGKGYVFGAFRPATGEAFTAPYDGRTTAHWVDFLERVEAWLPAAAGRVYAVLDNLGMHRALDVLLFALAHPRWAFVFQPTSAAYLNLIEPWWKVLRSLALKGRRFESWAEVCRAIEAATAYWNGHRHPFVWGRRRRHRTRRRGGLGRMPLAA